MTTTPLVRDQLDDVVDDLVRTIAGDHDGHLLDREQVQALVAHLEDLRDMHDTQAIDVEEWPTLAGLFAAMRAGRPDLDDEPVGKPCDRPGCRAPHNWTGGRCLGNQLDSGVDVDARVAEVRAEVDRYGITKRGEQYTGFKALGGGAAPAATATPTSMSKRAAAELLERLSIGDEGDARQRSVQIILNGDCDMARVVRDARAAAHPDRHAGDHAVAYDVDQAARVLGVTR